MNKFIPVLAVFLLLILACNKDKLIVVGSKIPSIKGYYFYKLNQPFYNINKTKVTGCLDNEHPYWYFDSIGPTEYIFHPSNSGPGGYFQNRSSKVTLDTITKNLNFDSTILNTFPNFYKIKLKYDSIDGRKIFGELGATSLQHCKDKPGDSWEGSITLTKEP